MMASTLSRALAAPLSLFLLPTGAAGCGGKVLFEDDGDGDGGSGATGAGPAAGAGPQAGGASTTGPTCELFSETRGASVASNDASVGNRAWEDVEAVIEGASGTAEVSAMTDGEISHYLTAQGFGFSLPATATVVGVEVSWTRSALSGGGLVDSEVRLLKLGSPAGANRPSFDFWGAAPVTSLTGGADDLWDTSWSVADVNDPSFGAALSVAYTSFAGNDWPQVTDVTVTVTFTDC